MGLISIQFMTLLPSGGGAVKLARLDFRLSALPGHTIRRPAAPTPRQPNNSFLIGSPSHPIATQLNTATQ